MTTQIPPNPNLSLGFPGPTPVPSTTLAASSASASGADTSLPQRPYEPTDLHGLSKVQLANLVLKQGHLWPVPPGKKFSETLIKRDTNC
ncbi:hypothetical protein PM082_024704 [Marasmius tenuissimus]|nr:hypothetical protein PM082_024704 [Marasmius tenuissimus]